jgi:hypothetical protein
MAKAWRGREGGRGVHAAVNRPAPRTHRRHIERHTRNRPRVALGAGSLANVENARLSGSLFLGKAVVCDRRHGLEGRSRRPRSAIDGSLLAGGARLACGGRSTTTGSRPAKTRPRHESWTALYFVFAGATRPPLACPSAESPTSPRGDCLSALRHPTSRRVPDAPKGSIDQPFTQRVG